MSEQQRGVRHPADDVEGHGVRYGGVADEAAQDDVEGHARRIPVSDEAAQDDVEGHGIRVRF